MKANEAPEKIWVHELSAKELNVPLKEYHIEYIRTDAFIEKAVDWFEQNLHMYNTAECLGDRESFIEEFKEAMKGE